MSTPLTRKVKDLTLVTDIQDGDILVGERTNGTTVRIPYVAPVIISDGDKGDITVSSSGTVWSIDTPSPTPVATNDKVLIKDTSASDVMKYVTAQSIADLASGGVSSVNGETGAVILDADDISDAATSNKFTSAADKTRLASTSGTNTGDQTSIVGISGTRAQFDTAVSDGNILYVGDVTQYTDEMAQDAVGGMVDTSLNYVDGTPLLQRAALTGDITASAGSNATLLTTPGSVSVATDDKILIKDTSASDVFKYVTAQSIRDIVPGSGTLTSAQLATALTNETGSGLAVFNDTPTLVAPLLGTPTSGVLTNCTGLPVAGGGTGVAAVTAYAPIVGGTTSTGAFQSTASGSTGQLLQSAGNAAVPTWTTATYPTTSGTTGKLLQSDGTNFVSSTATWPTAATNTKFIIGNGTNYVESTSTIPTSAGATALKHLKSDGTNYVLTTATISDTPSTAGKLLVSDGTNWITSTPTFPNASATTRKIIVSDGTNWLASTETYAVPGSAGNLLRSDGTNWIAGKGVLTTDVTGVLPVANGGTNASSASITAFNNITGYTAAGSTGTTSTNLVFSTSPTLVTPVLGVAAATSIAFGNEAMSTYDEGTFTPVFLGSTVAGTPTGTFQGRYVKIGKLVNVNVRAVFTGLDVMSGFLNMSGLPFTVVNATSARAGLVVGFSGNWANTYVVGGYAVQNTDTINFYNMEVDSTRLAIGDLTATTNIYFQLTYEATS